MADARYATVPMADGQEARVLVVSMHPDDAAAMRQLYLAEFVWDQCDATNKALVGKTGGADEKSVEALVELKLQRNAALRRLFGLVMANHHTGEQIEGMMRSCSENTATEIFLAAKGNRDLLLQLDERLKLQNRVLELETELAAKSPPPTPAAGPPSAT